MAKCPHCKNHISALRLTPVTGMAANGSSWNCLVAECPSCNTALGADLDLTAVRADVIATIEKLAKKLGVGPL